MHVILTGLDRAGQARRFFLLAAHTSGSAFGRLILGGFPRMEDEGLVGG